MALSSASSALDIPSDSLGTAGVDDLLLFVSGDDESLPLFTGESLDLLAGRIATCQTGEWLVVLFAIEVSGELTPESVEV